MLGSAAVLIVDGCSGGEESEVVMMVVGVVMGVMAGFTSHFAKFFLFSFLCLMSCLAVSPGRQPHCEWPFLFSSLLPQLLTIFSFFRAGGSDGGTCDLDFSWLQQVEPYGPLRCSPLPADR